jgi:pSer/pThr/pTyr-binding forkhead associated (FHA) protein
VDERPHPVAETWRAAAPTAVLVFPWGDLEVTHTIVVGRDPKTSPLGERLEREGYGWVSGKHAELFTEDGRLHVRDMGSTNGTYVNGKRIENRPVPLFDGDRVGFSRRLVATVRLTAR